jgi:trehalose-phosphatase
MQYVFDLKGMMAVRDFLTRDTLIALDYDGTLAPTVAQPELAQMRDETRRLLARLARRRPVVVMTGRTRSDALRLLSGIPVLEVIGSHGVETQGPGGTRFLPRVAQWRDALMARLRQLTGVRIEDKRYSLAIHYRQSNEPLVAAERIGEAAETLTGARVVEGKKAFELLPAEAPDKGMALLSACYRLGHRSVVYVGDDETDEPAYAVGRPGQVFGIRVGAKAESLARAYLRRQREIDRLLSLLVDPSAFLAKQRTAAR